MSVAPVVDGTVGRRGSIRSLVAVSGVVERGDQRGRDLGFPTANLSVPEGSPRDGVWAGWLVCDEFGVCPAAVSVGRRSTFYGNRGVRLLEAHVIDFDGSLYDLSVTVHLGHKLRGQRRFVTVEGLVAQLHDDVRDARDWCRLVAGS